ncbi:hypothetical protein SAMN05660909_02620 [Chitinophaga terrae (ex Kim and Jung 2007)]|uniref:Uncharacterized protein n=1 Tax=Chitinophaga terrae (ex Kim and Jung 2007) TaxID=408074 RepID=A0A1H4CG62_9BACT|nr:hypothetical protein [Chitinophaga terrae (ex Kim and Jung 2007)]SEA59406.1 hypothetical protein SAMN05660909_02620 [Chitinophaga terrae (ex Kim and Jung 2007)]
MEKFNHQNHQHLLDCVPLADHKQFIIGYNYMVDDLNEIESEYREKYIELYPDFNLDLVIFFTCNTQTRKLRYTIDINRHYSLMDEMDKITIIHESDAVIEHYMEPEIYRYLDEKV